VFIASFQVGPWQTNCYVLRADDSPDAIVVDPGVDAQAPVIHMLADKGWGLAGVLATHGHVDHIGDAARLANRFGAPLWMHGADDYMLTRPSAGLGTQWAPYLADLLGEDALPAPEHRVDLADGGGIEAAGLRLSITPAPGHTPGSVLARLDDDAGPLILCGDVVFAGSIGRTDLPGGDSRVMLATLRDVVSFLPGDARLLPGHGPATTMARERAVNPYLQRDVLEGSSL